MHLPEVRPTKHIPTLDQSRLDDLRNKLAPLLSQYTVEIEEACSLLSKVKLNKSVGRDGISHKILKELANVLAAPVTSLINSVCTVKMSSSDITPIM